MKGRGSYRELACRSPIRGQGKTEPGSAQSGLVIGFNVAVMRFNDGSANRQADAHAGVLCRKETFKKMREIRRIYARAAVLDDAAHCFGIGKHGSNENAAALLSRLHH